jgi:hypothetical protein
MRGIAGGRKVVVCSPRLFLANLMMLEVKPQVDLNLKYLNQKTFCKSKTHCATTNK